MPDYGDRVVVGKHQPQLALPLAELLLPDDVLPAAREYVAMSEWFGGGYPSKAALITKRKKVEARLNNEMADWQRAILAPCWVQYGVQGPGGTNRVLVFGEIPDLPAVIEAEAWNRIGSEKEKFGRRLRKRLEDANRRGWLYGRWYSASKPEGEFVCQHRAVMQEVIDHSLFEQIKADGWVRK